MNQTIELDSVRNSETEQSLDAIQQEVLGLREVLRSVLTRLGELEERKAFLEDRISEVHVRREGAEEDEAQELEKLDGSLFQLFRWRDES